MKNLESETMMSFSSDLRKNHFFQFTERDEQWEQNNNVLFLDLPFWLVGTCCKVEQKCDATTFANSWCVWARLDVWIRFNLTYFFKVCNFNFLMFTWSDSGSLTNLCAGGRWYIWFIILYTFGFFVFFLSSLVTRRVRDFYYLCNFDVYYLCNFA